MTRAKAVHRVRFKAEMSLGKQIRSPAKRSMNIHEKNAVRSHALCVQRDPGVPQFLFSLWGGAGARRQVWAIAPYAKTANPQTWAHRGAEPSRAALSGSSSHPPGRGGRGGVRLVLWAKGSKNKMLRGNPQVDGKARL